MLKYLDISVLVLIGVSSVINSVLLYKLLCVGKELLGVNTYSSLPSVEYAEDVEDACEEDYKAYNEYIINKKINTLKTPTEYIEQVITQEDESIEIITDLDEYKEQVLRRGY